jgi:hypothetical protein
MVRTVPRYSVDEENLRAYAGPLYFSYGSSSNPRWESMAGRMAARFPRCHVERYEGRHHLDASHQSEPARVAMALRELWRQ